jgi:hypothetical protein
MKERQDLRKPAALSNNCLDQRPGSRSKEEQEMRIVLVVTLAALLTAGAGASATRFAGARRRHVDSPEFAVQ